MKNIDIDNAQHCLSLWSHATGGYNKVAKALIVKLGLKTATKALLDGKIKQFINVPNINNAIVNLHNFCADGGCLLGPGDALWPDNLRKLQDSQEYWADEPICLWVNSANPSCLSQNNNQFIAVVGSRNASQYGLQVCKQFVRQLTDKGWTIISGGAFGIDVTAHQTALANNGTTISVMASGADHFFPTGNANILTQITRTGAVVSESPPRTPAYKANFLSRNRIIASLSAGTLLIEAPHRSGAINTLFHATNYDRPAGAVPGSVLTPHSSGCHRVINENMAYLITDADDFIKILSPKIDLLASVKLSEKQLKVLEILKPIKVTYFEEICATAKMSPLDVKSVISSLEQIDKVKTKNGGWISIN